MRRGRPPHDDILTPREWEVLQLIEVGLTNEQIAARLGVNVGTAKYHVGEILSKLQVQSRSEAPAAARHQKELRPARGGVVASLLVHFKPIRLVAALGAMLLIGITAVLILQPLDADDPLLNLGTAGDLAGDLGLDLLLS